MYMVIIQLNGKYLIGVKRPNGATKYVGRSYPTLDVRESLNQQNLRATMSLSVMQLKMEWWSQKIESMCQSLLMVNDKEKDFDEVSKCDQMTDKWRTIFGTTFPHR